MSQGWPTGRVPPETSRGSTCRGSAELPTPPWPSGGDPYQQRYRRPRWGDCRRYDLGHASGAVCIPQSMGNSPPPLTTTFHPGASLAVRTSLCAMSQRDLLALGLHRNPLNLPSGAPCLNLRAQSSASVGVFLTQAHIPASLGGPRCCCLALPPSWDRLPICPCSPLGGQSAAMPQPPRARDFLGSSGWALVSALLL